MFGFSLQKLVVLVAIVVAIWYGFKLLTRLQEARKADAALRQTPGSRARGPRSGSASGGGRGHAEDMVQCPTCQAFVPARGAKTCGRADCPY